MTDLTEDCTGCEYLEECRNSKYGARPCDEITEIYNPVIIQLLGGSKNGKV